MADVFTADVDLYLKVGFILLLAGLGGAVVATGWMKYAVWRQKRRDEQEQR